MSWTQWAPLFCWKFWFKGGNFDSKYKANMWDFLLVLDDLQPYFYSVKWSYFEFSHRYDHFEYQHQYFWIRNKSLRPFDYFCGLFGYFYDLQPHFYSIKWSYFEFSHRYDFWLLLHPSICRNCPRVESGLASLDHNYQSLVWTCLYVK